MICDGAQIHFKSIWKRTKFQDAFIFTRACDGYPVSQVTNGIFIQGEKGPSLPMPPCEHPLAGGRNVKLSLEGLFTYSFVSSVGRELRGFTVGIMKALADHIGFEPEFIIFRGSVLVRACCHVGFDSTFTIRSSTYTIERFWFWYTLTSCRLAQLFAIEIWRIQLKITSLKHLNCNAINSCYQVSNGTVPIGHLAADGRAFRSADPSASLTYQCLTFKTRPLRPLPPFGNIIRAFPPFVWALTIVTLIVFAGAFLLIHKVIPSSEKNY